jgi:hypothetical protein
VPSGDALASRMVAEGTISCGLSRRGDTNKGRNQIGHDANDHLYSFSVKGDSCEVSFDACEATFDTLLRVVSADGTVEFAKNDNCKDAYCCTKSGGSDEELRTNHRALSAAMRAAIGYSSTTN